MYPNKKHHLIPKGDYVTKEEALLDRKSDIQSRCESVLQMIDEEILPLEQALKAYDITIDQLIGYLMMKKERKTKLEVDDSLLLFLMNSILTLLSFSTKLNITTRKIVDDMRQLSGAK